MFVINYISSLFPIFGKSEHININGKELIAKLKAELKTELKEEIKAEIKTELRNELRNELKSELKAELKAELIDHIDRKFVELEGNIKSSFSKLNKDIEFENANTLNIFKATMIGKMKKYLDSSDEEKEITKVLHELTNRVESIYTANEEFIEDTRNTLEEVITCIKNCQDDIKNNQDDVDIIFGHIRELKNIKLLP